MPVTEDSRRLWTQNMEGVWWCMDADFCPPPDLRCQFDRLPLRTVLLVFLQTPLYGTSDHLRRNGGGEGDCADHKQNSRFQSPPFFLLCEIIVSDYAGLQMYSGIRKYHSWAKHILFQNWALSTRFRRCMSFANSARVEVEFCSDAFLETSD